MSLNINMLGLELSNDLILCLGILFILSGLLFFYFKRNLSILEKAQIEQAKLLQSVILSLQNLPSSNREVQLNQTNELIDISDNEDSDNEDSDNEDSDDEDQQEINQEDDDSVEISDNEELYEQLETIDPVKENDELKNEVKVVEMSVLEEASIDIDDESIEVESSVSGSINAITTESLVSLKSLKVADLRKMVSEKKLHTNPSKLKKDELIQILT